MKKTFTLFILFFLTTLLFAQTNQKTKDLEKGKNLFTQNCSSCHGITKTLIAHPLQHIRDIRGKDWVYKSTWNNFKFRTQNKKADAVFKKGMSAMPVYQNLTKADIDAICDYVDSFPYNPNSKEYNYRKN